MKQTTGRDFSIVVLKKISDRPMRSLLRLNCKTRTRPDLAISRIRYRLILFLAQSSRELSKEFYKITWRILIRYPYYSDSVCLHMFDFEFIAEAVAD